MAPAPRCACPARGGGRRGLVAAQTGSTTAFVACALGRGPPDRHRDLGVTRARWRRTSTTPRTTRDVNATLLDDLRGPRPTRSCWRPTLAAPSPVQSRGGSGDRRHRGGGGGPCPRLLPRRAARVLGPRNAHRPDFAAIAAVSSPVQGSRSSGPSCGPTANGGSLADHLRDPQPAGPRHRLLVHRPRRHR